MPLPTYSNKYSTQGTSFQDKYKPGGKKWIDETAVTWSALSGMKWSDLGPISYSDKYTP